MIDATCDRLLKKPESELKLGELLLPSRIFVAGELPRLRLAISGPHQCLADQHGVDTDAIQFLELP
jgi:hypothetical protein